MIWTESPKFRNTLAAFFFVYMIYTVWNYYGLTSFSRCGLCLVAVCHLANYFFCICKVNRQIRCSEQHTECAILTSAANASAFCNLFGTPLLPCCYKGSNSPDGTWQPGISRGGRMKSNLCIQGYLLTDISCKLLANWAWSPTCMML